ncbi:hypothetical protein [Azospirillum endophyticum]
MDLELSAHLRKPVEDHAFPAGRDRCGGPSRLHTTVAA